MKRIRRDTIRKLYREGLAQVFCAEADDYISKALKSDIHIAGQGPGQWVDPDGDGVLEIYCENGIPNATDYEDFSAEYREFGIPIPPEGAVYHNSDKWAAADDYVNLYLEAIGRPERVHHEPFNGAVVGVWWS